MWDSSAIKSFDSSIARPSWESTIRLGPLVERGASGWSITPASFEWSSSALAVGDFDGRIMGIEDLATL